MIETILSIKYRINQKKIALFTILLMISFLFFWGIKAVKAYYSSKTAYSFYGTTIGYFDNWDADINLTLYLENDDGEYIITKNIPQIGYYLNSLKSICTNTNAEISYDDIENKIVVNSDGKTSCKVYFSLLGETDLKTYFLVEDEDIGSVNYNNKNYKLVSKIPDLGYEYVGYNCINEDSIISAEYDANENEFSYSSSEKNVCYVYFDLLSNADLTVNIYVQNAYGSETYVNTVSIPTINDYSLNLDNSKCMDLNGNKTNAYIDYVDKKIVVYSEKTVVCDVYLDISS